MIKKHLVTLGALLVGVAMVAGCGSGSSDGDHIQPLTGLGAPSGAKKGSGPHPMPGANPPAGNAASSPSGSN